MRLFAEAKAKAEDAGHEVILLAADDGERVEKARAGIPSAWWHAEWAPILSDHGDHLGHKHNRLTKAAQAFDPDAFILIGSDDWMGPECFIRYAELAPHIEAFALSNILFAHAPTGRILEFTGPGIGVGRMVSRDILAACDWELWDGSLQKGLDASMASTVIRKTGKRFNALSMHDIGIVTMDIKTPVNMWSFERFVGRGRMVTAPDRDNIFTIFDRHCLTELRQLYPEMKP